MIKIVSFKICPFVQRVTALLEAKEVPYELEYISLRNKPQWFLDLSPTGQVPVLVTESGEALFESDAIIEYIVEVYGEPGESRTPVQRAQDRAWSYQASKHYLSQCSTMRSSGEEVLEERLVGLQKAFGRAEQALSEKGESLGQFSNGQLSNGQFFNGEALSNVDIAWLPLLHRADIARRHSGFDMLDGFPKMQAWQEALLDTGLAEKSVSEDFETVFTDFYLSDETYLGQLTKGLPEGVSGSACRSVKGDDCHSSACC